MEQSKDLFDSVLNLEENFLEEGKKQAENEGKALGLKEGFELGWQKGSEFSTELGYYLGCILFWKQSLSFFPHSVSERGKTTLDKCFSLIEQFEIENNSEKTNEQVIELLEVLRPKFKLLASQLGIQIAIQPNQLHSISF